MYVIVFFHALVDEVKQKEGSHFMTLNRRIHRFENNSEQRAYKAIEM